MNNDRKELIQRTIQSLEDILSQERKILLESPAEKIDFLTDKKNSLISKLSRESDQHRAEYTPEIMASIERCHALNKQNSDLVNQRLKITRQSLNIIRRHIGDKVVTLYDTTGKLNQKVESRKALKV